MWAKIGDGEMGSCCLMITVVLFELRKKLEIDNGKWLHSIVNVMPMNCTPRNDLNGKLWHIRSPQFKKKN